MDWSLLVCGRRGHTTYAPTEPELRAQLSAHLLEGEVWQCLRCGAFVPGPPSATGPADEAPMVPRGKQIRSHAILKVFAIERFLRFVIFAIASFFLWKYRHSQARLQHAFNREIPVLRGLFRQLGYNVDHSKLVGLLRHALTLSSHAITLLAIAAALYALIELIEAVGLWLAKRWGEYFAMIATSFGLPLEIYDLTRKFTVTALVLLVVNLALVLYLAITKRLFGVRGGKRAYHERLWEESVMEHAEEAVRRSARTEVPAPVPGPPTAPAPAAAGNPSSGGSRPAEERSGSDSRSSG